MAQKSDADRDKKRLEHARSTFDSAYSDIILRASANVTRLSIVIFTSMPNVPIITVSSMDPIFNKEWLFIGLNMSGLGHFCVIKENEECFQYSGGSVIRKRKSTRNSCYCGSKRKDMKPKCVTLKDTKYSSKCPCLKQGRSYLLCDCNNCQNPNGASEQPKRVNVEQPQRKRIPAQLQPTAKSSIDFLKEHEELAGQGSWTDEETFLLRYVIDTGTNETEKTFNEMAERLSLCGLPLSLKTAGQISSKSSLLKTHSEFSLAKIAKATEALIQENKACGQADTKDL